MNKLNPRNKICFQTNINIHKNLNLFKLKSKKWNLFKKKLRYQKEIKPEKRKKFFQKRLFETQQFRNFYGCIQKYKLKNIFKKLNKKNKKINIFPQFTILLESRLDINLVRLKFVKTIFQAKQLINHKKIKVNKKIISKPNCLLNKGDIINIKKKKYAKKKTKS